MTHLIARRGLMKGALAMAAMTTTSTVLSGAAAGQDATTSLPSNYPGLYSFSIGEWKAVVLSDGPLDQGDPVKVLKGHSADEIHQVLRDNFLNENNMSLDQNVLLLQAGDRLVLFDTGTGGAPLFGDLPGKLISNFERLGINPHAVTDVILTHAHPDHIWGMTDQSETEHFPNAQVHIHETDYEFFVDPANDSHSLLGPFMPACRRELEIAKGRLNLLKDGQEVLPGITTMFAPGHTPGHTIFGIQSGNKSMILTADLAHHHAIFTKYPDIQFGFDTDPQQMVETRSRYFDMIATDRLPFLSYHFPFPGIGNLERANVGYRWVAAGLDNA